MTNIISFPKRHIARQPRPAQLANTFSSNVKTATFVLDDYSVVRPNEELALSGCNVHLEMICGNDVTVTHVFHVHAHFSTQFPHINFSFSSKTSDAVTNGYIVVCCVEKEEE